MRVVIKIGTSTLAHANGHLNIRRVEELCKVISDLKNSGCEIILVSSGAIGMGVGKLSLKEKPQDIPTKQAAAAVGQCELMYTYDRLFQKYHHTVAQILFHFGFHNRSLTHFRQCIVHFIFYRRTCLFCYFFCLTTSGKTYSGQKKRQQIIF